MMEWNGRREAWRSATAALALALLVARLAPAAAAAGAHERACGAAFGVLRHCASTGGGGDAVHARCCGLLEAFQRNGCLCPDCPADASAGAASPTGLLLAAELSPLMDLCGADSRASTQQAQQAQRADDEDDLMADMSGLAAAAQDPARAAQVDRAAAAAVAARATAAAQERRRQEAEDSPLMDTPEDDYDNMLSDADTPYMLVDPAAARSYAAHAADVARQVAADVAASLASGRATAAEVEVELEARVEALLARHGFSRGSAGGGAAQQAQQGQQAEAEAVASSAAVGDESAEPAAPGELPPNRGRVPVVLARADRVPQGPERQRAEALAAALERQQERNLATRVARQRAQHAQQADGQPDEPVKKLSLDITIDADNPEAARRMVGSLASLIDSWQASGGAHDQAELAAALEAAAARVAAASGKLGRAGLQPRQLTLEQVEEQGSKPRVCACMDVELPPVDGPAPDLRAALHRRYVATRLALCRFACQHQQTLAVLLVVELALCVAWAAVWLLRGARGTDSDEEEADVAERYHAAPAQRAKHAQQAQFLVASAADPQWRSELKEPLLGTGASPEGSSCSSC